VFRLTAAILAVIVALYNVHVFWTMSLHYDDDSNLTCDAADDNYFMMHVFEYLKLVSYCVVPFVIVIVLNTCIIVRLRRTCPVQRTSSVSVASSVSTTPKKSSTTSRSRRYFFDRRSTTPDRFLPHNAAAGDEATTATALLPSDSTSSRREVMTVEVLASGPQQSRQRRLTRMLLFVSFAWLALSAPFALHSLATYEDEGFSDRKMLAKIICFLLVYTNHAINLYSRLPPYDDILSR